MGALLKVQMVDDSTGEIIKERVQRGVPYYDDAKGLLLFPKKVRVSNFPEVGRFPKSLSMADIGRMFLLSQYTVDSTNVLCMRDRKGIRPMDKDDMLKITRLGKRQFWSFWDRVRKGKIIKRVRNNDKYHYVLNPLYFFNGKWLPVTLYFVFKEEISAHLPQWAIERLISGGLDIGIEGSEVDDSGDVRLIERRDGKYGEERGEEEADCLQVVHENGSGGHGEEPSCGNQEGNACYGQGQLEDQGQQEVGQSSRED